MRQIEGNNANFLGELRGQYGKKKDELLKWADPWSRRHSGNHEVIDALTGNNQPERHGVATIRGKVDSDGAR